MNRISSLSLQLGDNQNSRNLVWYNLYGNKKAYVRYAKKEDYLTDGFNGKGTITTEGTVCNIYKNPNHVSCKATVTDLSYGCEYCYQVGSETGFSKKTYCFKVPEQDLKSYRFSLISDAHLKDLPLWNSPAKPKKETVEKWGNFLDTVAAANPECIVSLGDNISSYNMNFIKKNERLRKGVEKEMDLFFSPKIMKEIPLVSVMGNHDFSPLDKPDDSTSITGYHFNLPHDDGVSGHCLNNSCGNFWYRLRDVLIIGINIFENSDGNRSGTSVKINNEYAKKALEQNKDAKWRIVMLHINTYSHISGKYEIINNFINKLCSENNIDIVFNGHAHAYSLSYQIENGEPVDIQNIEKAGKSTYKTINPRGTLHCNVPCAMYHSFSDVEPDYKKYIRSYGLTDSAAKNFPDFCGLTFNGGCFMNVDINNNPHSTSLSLKLIQEHDNRTLEEYIIQKSL